MFQTSKKSIFGLYHRYRTTQEGPNRDLNAGPRAVESIQSANHTTRPSGLDNWVVDVAVKNCIYIAVWLRKEAAQLPATVPSNSTVRRGRKRSIHRSGLSEINQYLNWLHGASGKLRYWLERFSSQVCWMRMIQWRPGISHGLYGKSRPSRSIQDRCFNPKYERTSACATTNLTPLKREQWLPTSVLHSIWDDLARDVSILHISSR